MTRVLVEPPEVGDFVQVTLVTDTKVFEVVKVTPHTIVVRPCRQTDVYHAQHLDGNPFPVVFTEVEPSPGAPTRRLRQLRNRAYRMWGTYLREATKLSGRPVEYTDYRM